MSFTNMPRHDFYVWSPEHGGCIMLTRYHNGKRINWSSHCEGEHPTCDDAAKLAVKCIAILQAKGLR